MIVFVSGCRRSVENEVVLCATVDQEIAAPMMGAFYRAQEGVITPKARFGIDASDIDAFVDEVTGMTDGFHADLIWSDDIFLMTELARRGVLKSHAWKTEATFPDGMKATDGTWRAMAATARVLIVNTDLLTEKAQYPRSVDDLTDVTWKGKCGIANPTRGAMAIHAGIIASQKGNAADDWFKQVSDNAVVVKRDAEVATAVAKGTLAWGLTSSSDAVAEQDASSPIAVVFPDQSPDKPGTVRIPNAVGIVASAQHPVAAARLADYLVSPTVEERLAMSDASQIPISPIATYTPRVLTGEIVRWSMVDFDAAAKAFDAIQPSLEKNFTLPRSEIAEQ